MQKKNVYLISNEGKKVTLFKNVFSASVCGNDGLIHNYFIEPVHWKAFKEKHKGLYSDNDLTSCLSFGIVPHQLELVGGTYLIESVSKKG